MVKTREARRGNKKMRGKSKPSAKNSPPPKSKGGAAKAFSAIPYKAGGTTKSK